VYRRADGAGFTLIEVMVALAIIAIALLAALRAAGQGVATLDDLRARLLAGWVAENRLAEHRARGAWLPLGVRHGTEREGAIEFGWREEVIGTPHPAFRRVDVFVFAAAEESRTLAHLTGFAVNPPAGGK
jgi:general secretion pathway protein I